MTALAALDAAQVPGAVTYDPATVRAARREAGYSLERAAQWIGRDPSSLSRYESGETVPPANVLAALAFVYGVHPGAFFTPQT